MMEFDVDNCSYSAPVQEKTCTVPLLNNDISYNLFFETFMNRNVPCVIKNATQGWEAKSKWLLEPHVLDLRYLKEHYGSCDITVYNCDERYFNSQITEQSKFEDFLTNSWNNRHESKYLKDWHLMNTFKDDRFYEVPVFFASDWLNEFLVENNADDYRFVYMGQAGTWTPFHADVFSSFSWSANICGKKRWILFPPGEENQLRDALNNLPYDIDDVYSHHEHYEVIQDAGDAIFVPSGWYHQVWNLEDTVSVNHNWVNGCNVHKMWAAMKHDLDIVKKEIEDCRDMDNFQTQCQLLLKASFGMDFAKFHEFLNFILQKRSYMLSNPKERTMFHGHGIGTNHIMFDLRAVKTVMEDFLQHPDVFELINSKIVNIERITQDMAQIDT